MNYYPEWRLARQEDIPSMTDLAIKSTEQVSEVFQTDPAYYAYQLDLALAHQRHNLAVEQIIVCRDARTDQLLSYAWVSRGGRAVFSQDEMAEGRVVMIEPTLPTRLKLRLVEDTLQHWIHWCEACGIPILVSTSIRKEHTAFMRLHLRAGFLVRGNWAYRKVNY